MQFLRRAALALVVPFGTAAAFAAPAGACKAYEGWVGQGRVNIVDFSGADASSPLRFRLRVHGFEDVNYQAREVACNRQPVPAGVDPFDLGAQLDNRSPCPERSPRGHVADAGQRGGGAATRSR